MSYHQPSQSSVLIYVHTFIYHTRWKKHLSLLSSTTVIVWRISPYIDPLSYLGVCGDPGSWSKLKYLKGDGFGGSFAHSYFPVALSCSSFHLTCPLAFNQRSHRLSRRIQNRRLEDICERRLDFSSQSPRLVLDYIPYLPPLAGVKDESWRWHLWLGWFSHSVHLCYLKWQIV